ncbi:MAG: class I SAM-dependent methyltransferase [Dehalococcoidia bacterium]
MLRNAIQRFPGVGQGSVRQGTRAHAAGDRSHLARRQAHAETAALVREASCRTIAVVGIEHGDAALAIATALEGAGEIHLFDESDLVDAVAIRLLTRGYRNAVRHGDSPPMPDPYSRSLIRMLAAHPEPIFDYVVIDGGHRWHRQAHAFLLIDRLLLPGGYVDFNDGRRSIDGSPSVEPLPFPATAPTYVEDSFEGPQGQLAIDLLVRRDQRYEEVIPNKAYRKAP